MIKGITEWIDNWKKKNWRIKVENKDLWEQLDSERDGLSVNWVCILFFGNNNLEIYVKGHSGVEGNEAADKLAVAGCALPLPDATETKATNE